MSFHERCALRLGALGQVVGVPNIYITSTDECAWEESYLEQIKGSIVCLGLPGEYLQGHSLEVCMLASAKTVVSVDVGWGGGTVWHWGQVTPLPWKPPKYLVVFQCILFS